MRVTSPLSNTFCRLSLALLAVCTVLLPAHEAQSIRSRGLGGRAQAPKTTRPNVLVMVIDDLGVDVPASYGLGANPPKTPNMDALAQGGLLFRNAWATPICPPTRATLQTGRLPFRSGVGSAIFTLERNLTDLHLEEQFTIPKMLAAGTNGLYRTAAIGKWHLSYRYNADGSEDVNHTLTPNLAGYDHFSGAMFNIPAYGNWPKVVNGVKSTSTKYALTDKVDESLAWLANGPSSGKPWLLYLAFHMVHVPIHAPPAHLHSVDLSSAPNPEDNLRLYFDAMLEAMDTEMGRLLGGIDALGQLENTTVILLGDNGTFGPVKSPGVNKGEKGDLFEGGVNVPFIVSGPLVASPGSESDAFVSTVDVYATVAEIAGVDLPAVLPPGYKIDSISLVPYMMNSALPSLRSVNVTELYAPNGIGEGLPVPVNVPDPNNYCQTDLGFQGPGSVQLELCGQVLAVGGEATLHLTGAPPGACGTLYTGFGMYPVPFFGGTLVPSTPGFAAKLIQADSQGEYSEPIIPTIFGTKVYFQVMMQQDCLGTQPFEFSNAIEAEIQPYNAKAIRNDRYKLISSVNGGRDFLYDLDLDPMEATNLVENGPGNLTPAEQIEYDALKAALDALMQTY